MVIPLPVNSTAVNQPLDVDVMGPLNRIVRALGLMGQTITKKEKEQGKKRKRRGCKRQESSGEGHDVNQADNYGLGANFSEAIVEAFEKPIPQCPPVQV
ncbi:hypothetical protein GQ600_10111 [Phytophthora cactorum]|nr:hypothetical protein GQ600_10111 [Phytophthora cactorum]